MTRALPLIVVSGMVGSGKTTFINHLLKERGSLRLGIVQHTLTRREIPGASTGHAKLKGPKSGTEVQVVEVMIEHEEAAAAPCLDEAYLEEVFELAQDPGLRAIIIEPTGGCRPQEVVQGFEQDMYGPHVGSVATVTTLVTVVNAGSLLDQLATLDLVSEQYPEVRDETAVMAQTSIEQVEQAQVLYVNFVERPDQDDEAKLLAALKLLNPDAEVWRSDVEDPERFRRLLKDSLDLDRDGDVQALLQPLWLQAGPGPATAGPLVRAVFQADRPFHPERLYDLAMGDELDVLIRSKGWLWLATRSADPQSWSQVGPSIQLASLGAWWDDVPREEWPEGAEAQIEELLSQGYGKPRQDLILIGSPPQLRTVEPQLRACLLTDEELAAGPGTWSTWTDEFPEDVHEHDHDHDGGHDHDHDHDHDHHGHRHDHDCARDHDHDAHGHRHDHDCARDHDHDHQGHRHDHDRDQHRH